MFHPIQGYLSKENEKPIFDPRVFYRNLKSPIPEETRNSRAILSHPLCLAISLVQYDHQASHHKF